MWKEINGRNEMRAKRYPSTLRHTLEIDWLPMMDELAGMIGCKPNLSMCHEFLVVYASVHTDPEELV